MVLEKKTKKKMLATKVRFLHEVSKTGNENLPFVAVCYSDLPKSLQKLKSSDYESGSRLNSKKKAGINVSSKSKVLFKLICQSLQMTKTVDFGCGRLSKPVKTFQVLKTIPISRDQQNVKFNKKNKEKYRIKKPSQCSSSTTSVSVNKSEH